MVDINMVDNLLPWGSVALVGGMLIAVIIFALAIYVYTSLAFSTIGRKLKYDKPWLAWIPIANVAMILQMGKFHWAWVFLILVPILGWIPLMVMAIISLWRIYEKRKYPGWLCLLGIGGVIPIIGTLFQIANLVVMGMVAWKDR